MVRRGQREQRQLRKARLQTTEALEAGQGSYQPPDRVQCTLRQWEIPYDDAGTVRLQFLLWRHEGRVVDFVVNVQLLGADGWEVVEYFDCCHGHFHLHAKGGAEPQSILRLDDLADVQRAFVQVDQESRVRARIIRDEGAP